MSKEQIIDEVYENYVKSFFKGELKKNYEGGGYDIDDYYYSIIDVQHLLGWPQDGPVSKKEFINKCKTDDALSIKWREEYRDFRYGSKEEIEHLSKHYKTDSEFSEKWGLKIEERELSLEERAKWLQDNKGYDLLVGNLEHDHIREVVEDEAPTKHITITYNNKTIETYE